MEYEIITSNVNYYIGGNNQVPISNTGKLIRKLRDYGPYKKPLLRHNRIAFVYLNLGDWRDVIEKLKIEIAGKLGDIWHINNIDLSDFTYDSSDFNSIKTQIDKAIDLSLIHI